MGSPDALSETGPDAAAASRTVLLVVFATILIDFIGFSVLIPVLPLFAERLGASPLQVALILTVYALAQLLFLPAWGWVSDRVGRRPVILISLFGTVCSFVVLAFADSIGMIYAARVLAGFFAASIGTAQAVVTDVTSPSERARGMGIIGAAFGAGMIVGPMLGGLTAELHEKAPRGAIHYLKKLYYDVAASATPFALPSLLALADVSHVLFGTDYPFMPEATIGATIAGINDHDGFDMDQRMAVEKDNALELFPRFRKAGS